MRRAQGHAGGGGTAGRGDPVAVQRRPEVAHRHDPRHRAAVQLLPDRRARHRLPEHDAGAGAGRGRRSCRATRTWATARWWQPTSSSRPAWCSPTPTPVAWAARWPALGGSPARWRACRWPEIQGSADQPGDGRHPFGHSGGGRRGQRRKRPTSASAPRCSAAAAARALGGYGNTSEGKIVVASYIDNWNNIVRTIRNQPLADPGHSGSVAAEAKCRHQRARPAPVPPGRCMVPKISGAKAFRGPSQGAASMHLSNADEVIYEGEKPTAS